MNEVAKLVARVLQSKYFWIAVGLIILFVVIKRNWYKIQKLKQPRYVEYETDETGKVVQLTANTKRQLEALARDINTEINDIGGSLLRSLNPFYVPETYKKVSQLSDQELLYLSQFYSKAVTRGESTLHEDINDELMPQTKVDEELLARLSQIGEA